MHSFVFCFLKSSPLPMVYAGLAGDSAPGGEWLLPWFLLYLPTCDLSAIIHTCLSSTCCSPRRTTTAHKISVYCACKKRIRHILLTSRACYKSVHIIKFISLLPHFASHCNTGRARMAMEGEDEEGKSVVAKSMGESRCVTCANMDLVGHLLYSCVTHVTQIWAWSASQVSAPAFIISCGADPSAAGERRCCTLLG